MKRILALAATFTLLLVSCGSSTAEVTSAESATSSPSTTVAETSGPIVQRFWILPDTVECIGEAVQQCMQVADAEDGEYLYFYDAIEGFTFDEGTSYVIDVEVSEVVDPPADGSSLSYRLVNIIESSS